MKNFFLTIINSFLFVFSYLNATPTVDNFHVFTIASKRNAGLDRLLESCKYYEVEIDVLGMGLPYEGNGEKIIYTRKYLDNLSDDDVVLFVDGYDTFFLADKETILNKFLEKDVPCIFGAGISMHKEGRCNYDSPSKFKCLNSGTIIGYVGFLRKLYGEVKKIDKKYSDQMQLTPYYLKYKDQIFLDHEVEFFFTLRWVKPNEFKVNAKERTVECLETGTKPFIIHGNYDDGKVLYKKMFEEIFTKK